MNRCWRKRRKREVSKEKGCQENQSSLIDRHSQEITQVGHWTNLWLCDSFTSSAQSMIMIERRYYVSWDRPYIIPFLIVYIMHRSRINDRIKVYLLIKIVLLRCKPINVAHSGCLKTLYSRLPPLTIHNLYKLALLYVKTVVSMSHVWN